MTTLENRYRLHCTGEEPKAQRGYIAGLGNISIKCLLNGRAGTYIQIAYFFFLISSVKVCRDPFHLSLSSEPRRVSDTHEYVCEMGE